jgi:putative endonuclease
MAEHNELGKKGEKLAIDFLIENDYKILEKNYRYLKAEVDIIARKKDVLVAVEVKTRSSDYFGNPQDFITQKKIKLLISAIDYYIVQ